MLQWLKDWLWQRKMAATERELRSIIRQRGGEVVVEVVPKQLALTSFFPDNPKTGRAVLRSPDGTQTVKEATYYSSTWDGEARFSFWPNRLRVSVLVSAKRPSPAILSYLRELLGMSPPLKELIEQAIIDRQGQEFGVRMPTDVWKRFSAAGTLFLDDEEATIVEMRLKLQFPERSAALQSLVVELHGGQVHAVYLQ